MIPKQVKECVEALERAIDSHTRLRLAEWMTESQALRDVSCLLSLKAAIEAGQEAWRHDDGRIRRNEWLGFRPVLVIPLRADKELSG